MMGLQAATKTSKRKYEIVAECGSDKKEEGSPPKTIKYSEAKIVSINKTTISKGTLKSDTDIIPPEPHHWPNEPIVDSISKLQAVTETWSSATLSSISFNSSSSTLSSLAQTAENVMTRSTLATTLLDQDDLMDDDEDDFQDDFDFDEEDEEDDLLDEQTILTNQNYTPIRYPSPSSPTTRQNYIPAYPKPGYTPEPYQNCSRTPTAAAQYNGGTNHNNNNNHHHHHHHHQQSHLHLRPSFFNGTNNGNSNMSNGNWNYYTHQHYDLAPSPQQPQTIRCAENGKSYFELGSSNYCGPNRLCNGGIGIMKNCCDGRNNLWCTAKQCYKEKRLKMMNLSMFKLARFRQASDQSLYRSVLICNTLKSLEKEIELENQIYHQRLQNHHRQALHQNQTNLEYAQSFVPRLGANAESKQQQQQQPQPPQNSIINCNSNLSSNTSFSQPYLTNNCIINRISSFNEPIPYEHHPLKDPSSGRATPFPTSPGISQLASSSLSTASDTDSAFGDVDDSNTRSIDWGSVLSLSSQSALDPLSNSDIFTSSTSNSTSTSLKNSQNSTTIANLNITISNNGSSIASNISTTPSVSMSTPISSIITTLTTVSSCSLESLTASSISSTVSNTNWDFPYLETESSNNSEFYELNCYKLASAFNSMDEFVKSEPLVTPVSVNPSSGNDLEQLTHHIMVGS